MKTHVLSCLCQLPSPDVATRIHSSVYKRRKKEVPFFLNTRFPYPVQDEGIQCSEGRTCLSIGPDLANKKHQQNGVENAQTHIPSLTIDKVVGSTALLLEALQRISYFMGEGRMSMTGRYQLEFKSVCQEFDQLIQVAREDSSNNCYFIPLARNRRYWRTYIRSCLVGKSIDEGKHPRPRKRMHFRKQARTGELVEQRGKSVSPTFIVEGTAG